MLKKVSNFKSTILQFTDILIIKRNLIKKLNFPNTEQFCNQVISLPIYYNLSKKTQLYVINC